MARSRGRLKIRVIKWGDHQARADVKRPSWFKLDNRLVENPEFYDFDGDEFKAWIYILSLASQKRSDMVVIVFDHAQRVANIPEKKLRSAIQKLVDNDSLEILNVDNSRTDRVQIPPGSCTDRDRDPNARQEEIGRERKREEERREDETPARTDADESEQLTPKAFFDLWNKHSGDLPRATKLTDDRRKKIACRIGENSDPAYWVAVITALVESDFASGRIAGSDGRTWSADFDWLIKNETNHVKVSEGKYRNKKANAPLPSSGDKISELERFRQAQREREVGT
jgi:hypothetical protein